MIPNKQFFRSYLINNGFVKVFEIISDVLSSLGDEWTRFGKKEWGTAFNECSVKMNEIIVVLTKLEDEFANEK